MQKFFEPSIESDFIKSLLYYTPTPIFEPVEIGDYVLAGQSYLYNSMLIRCRKTGYLDLHKIDPKYISITGNDSFKRYKPFYQTLNDKYMVCDFDEKDIEYFISADISDNKTDCTISLNSINQGILGIKEFAFSVTEIPSIRINNVLGDVILFGESLSSGDTEINNIGEYQAVFSLKSEKHPTTDSTSILSFKLVGNQGVEQVNWEDVLSDLHVYVQAYDSNGAPCFVSGKLHNENIVYGEYDLTNAYFDFNADGEVTEEDAIYLLYYASFGDTYPIPSDAMKDKYENYWVTDSNNEEIWPNGDCNGDGEVTDADAIYLLYHTFYPTEYTLNFPQGVKPTKTITKSVMLCDFMLYSGTNAQEAEYDILTYYNFGDYGQKATPIFNNSSSYYDSKTHKALGNYLRAYRSSTGIDLMPFYNCYGCETVRNVYFRPDTKTQKWVLTQEGLYNKASEQYVVYSVPIHFNKRYLIHIENMAGTTLKSVIYDEEGGFVTDTDTQEFVSIVESNGGTDPLHVGGTRFEDPIEYQVFLQDQPYPSYAYGFRTNLRLFIQVPKGKESTLVVTETDGVYTPMYSSEGVSIQVNAEDIEGCPSPIQNNVMFSQPELTKINTGSQYAFSDTLIQYLLLNAIDKEDRIEGNVERVQEALYGAVGEKESGQFSDSLRAALFNKYMLSGMTKYDINGFVDKSVENYLRKKTAYKGL